ncbi:transcriptional regulator, ArsR family [Halomicrobium zhouii]|uniref:Transcriptional regulator, ArsR family n=1 Tax=Halomicrobium zhouii TaxID=767519 RepID=A0A1I6K524_9EURY|nr:helix-turn-helix domain-containing protein [Halomicrobium zhouii]SFR85930.1 transcriptional regulator, ArsR family [Halomicrobium zhouii]
MSLLPSRDPATPDAEPRVIGVDSEDADDVLAALSAGTARKLLAELNETPAPPGELADRVDTSLQNAQYHLEKLETAGAVEVVDTAYSEKGREMDVYAPANQPLVICAGGEQETSGVRSALTSLLGGVGALAVASLLVQQLFGRGLETFFGPSVERGSAGGTTPDPSYLTNGTSAGGASAQATELVTETAASAAGPAQSAVGTILPPGLAFFAGGAVVLAFVFAIWYVDR